ncbi:MAG: radical SAM protein [Candidatus Omnitrophica bacterium]|nr:radical SAM protein [Candidatus Omnitrophota bacterium]
MAQEYLQELELTNLPRLPLEGIIDLAYRCNNNCRHCWLRIPPDAVEKRDELTFEEIKRIVDEAKKLGCRRWSISGGEPMLRPDFADIFGYITANFASYSINTNGTLITPKIARLMKKKGTKMVALYGATKDVHDHITRNPGSFEAAMRGFRYLKEAGAGFTVQLIPMKDNYHQFQDMVKLSESLSKHYRVGAAWLYLSACADKKRNTQIIRQRLAPKEVVELDKPDLSYEEWNKQENNGCHQAANNGYLFSSCINNRRDFHIDPYGEMTFCCFIKDPAMRYNLRKGSFQDGWDNFIPSLAVKVRITEEYKKNCGSCDLRADCRLCPVYAYLEHGRFAAKINYLCEVAKENKKFKENWRKKHRRYFKIADITIQVESDLPIKENTFHPKFKHFPAAGPSCDMISIRHHFSLPDLVGKELGEEVYRKAPWAIYKKDNSWIYQGISPTPGDKSLHRVAVFNSDHTRGRIYNDREEIFIKGNLHSLTFFPSDQILLARILADRQGCYLHSCGVNLDGQGLLFAGHSEAGKSTMATMLKGKAEILCDDRMIIRGTLTANRTPLTEFRIHGTWSHGDVPEVSGNSAPLRAILFLKKSKENRVTLLKDKREITKQLLSCVIRPFVTTDWWEKTLSLIENISDVVPCYELYFDKSGEVVELLKRL